MHLKWIYFTLMCQCWLSGGLFAGFVEDYRSEIRPLLQRHCGSCHGDKSPAGGVNLAAARDEPALRDEAGLWSRVLEQLEARTMPPAESDPLPDQDRQTVIGWVRAEYFQTLAEEQRQAGRSQLRRLNRQEYSNTIEDLLGIRPSVDTFLPSDGRIGGFDKVAQALPLSSEAAWGYVQISGEIMNQWVTLPYRTASRAKPPWERVVRAPAMESGESPGHTLKLEDGVMVSFNSDVTSGRLKFDKTRYPGRYRLRLSVRGHQTKQPLPFGIYAGKTYAYPQELELVKVLEAPPDQLAVLECEVYLKAKAGLRLIPFGLGVQVPKNTQASECRGPGLAVQWVEIEAPDLPLPAFNWLTADFPEALRAAYLQSSATAIPGAGKKPGVISVEQFDRAMKKTFQRIGSRFYRRDLSEAELNQLIKDIHQQGIQGATLERAFAQSVTSLMTSPEFLCVIEEAGPLSDFALASRLAYFLWNSTPDEELLNLARAGKLANAKVLSQQTDRLLKHPRAERFVEDFVNQWLGLRAIDDTSPDPVLYPEYDPLLKISSLSETHGAFRRILQEDRSVKEFVAPNWAYVNDRLAKHYGMPAVEGFQMRFVNLPASSPYGGFWTQSAVMKVTANGTNTSPVKRGVWVADRLLGQTISPPPPNIDPVQPDVRGAKSLREQLDLHRGKGACAACHAKFDHFGFALESFDVTGGYRQAFRTVKPEAEKTSAAKNKSPGWRDGVAVDPSGVLPNGQTFKDIRELRAILAQQPEVLARGVTRHLVTYATGEPAGPVDQPEIDRIVESCSSSDYGLRSLIHAIIQSDLFRYK